MPISGEKDDDAITPGARSFTTDIWQLLGCLDFAVKDNRNGSFPPPARSRHGCAMNNVTIAGAVLTIRRAIEEQYPPGPERERWLAWLREVSDQRKAQLTTEVPRTQT
jgi:hypothetical protein